jgi:hypothetical protein
MKIREIQNVVDNQADVIEDNHNQIILLSARIKRLEIAFVGFLVGGGISACLFLWDLV